MAFNDTTGTLQRVQSSIGNDAGAGTIRAPMEDGWAGLIAGRFGGSAGWTDLCFYDLPDDGQDGLAPYSLLIRHPSGFIHDGLPAAVKGTFDQLIAGQFAVANPELNDPLVVGGLPIGEEWLETMPEDLKHNLSLPHFNSGIYPFDLFVRDIFLETQYEDFLCYKAPVGSEPVNGTLNFWRYRPGNEWVRGKVEGYVVPVGIGDSVVQGGELEFHLSSNMRTVGGTFNSDPLRQLLPGRGGLQRRWGLGD